MAASDLANRVGDGGLQGAGFFTRSGCVGRVLPYVAINASRSARTTIRPNPGTMDTHEAVADGSPQVAFGHVVIFAGFEGCNERRCGAFAVSHFQIFRA